VEGRERRKLRAAHRAGQEHLQQARRAELLGDRGRHAPERLGLLARRDDPGEQVVGGGDDVVRLGHSALLSPV
jgi:hypothetical protein